MDSESPRRQLQRLGIHARKGLGQHFLVNAAAADNIVAAALEPGPERIVEIGPGLGVLTRRLAASGLPLVAIEKDEAFAPELSRFEQAHPNLQVCYQDVLRTDLAELTAQGRTVAVGNIPYQITSPLLEQLLSVEPPFAAIVVMIQREVGLRLAAEPATPEYGALTLLARFYADRPEVIAQLSPGSFYPPPKVHSVVVRLTPRMPPIADRRRRELFFTVVRAAFGQRRKQLINALSGAPDLTLDKQQAAAVLAAAGIAASRRGETLSLEEFVALTDALGEHLC